MRHAPRGRSAAAASVRPKAAQSARAGSSASSILGVFTVLAVVPDLLVGPLQTAVTASGPRLAPPIAAFLLGTDELGRSMLNSIVHATRISMVIGLLATIVITVAVGAVHRDRQWLRRRPVRRA